MFGAGDGVIVRENLVEVRGGHSLINLHLEGPAGSLELASFRRRAIHSHESPPASCAGVAVPIVQNFDRQCGQCLGPVFAQARPRGIHHIRVRLRSSISRGKPQQARTWFEIMYGSE